MWVMMCAPTEERAMADRSAAAKKAAQTRKRWAAGKKAALTRKRREAGRKAAATRKLKKEQSAPAPPAPQTEVQITQPKIELELLADPNVDPARAK